MGVAARLAAHRVGMRRVLQPHETQGKLQMVEREENEMSDRQIHVVLPPRGFISRMAGGFTHAPHAYDVTKLAEIHYSGIAVFRSLCVWQDDISKQVFWWAGYTDNTEIYPNNENKPLYDCHVILPETFDQFRYFYLGWGCEYHHGIEDFRYADLELIKAAVDSCQLTAEDIYKSQGFNGGDQDFLKELWSRFKVETP